MREAMTNVPIASDGSFFGPHLLHGGKYRVGDKGDEKVFRDFSKALAFLKSQPIARWRRPNAKGNWGIVTAVAWVDRPSEPPGGPGSGLAHVPAPKSDNVHRSFHKDRSPDDARDAHLRDARPKASQCERTPLTTGGYLPPHGRISCSTCFSGQAEWGRTSREEGGWILENNPCAWGSIDPRYLVLGFSKGTRQCKDLLAQRHEDIPAAGFRPKLTSALRVLGLMSPDEKVEDHFRADEVDWAFGSVVRCSIAKINPGTGKPEKSGNVIAESARRQDGSDWIGQCMSQWLRSLPPRLQIVVLLSNDDEYVDACFQRIRQLHPPTHRINDVAYGDGRVTWVHIVHVGGPGINHIEDWLAGAENKQGRKRRLALEALCARSETE